jgi:hypothetical protein
MTAETRNNGRSRDVIARQRHDKQFSAATDTDGTIEDAMFSMRSAQSVYNEGVFVVEAGSNTFTVALRVANGDEV